jgi:hypothetical protein
MTIETPKSLPFSAIMDGWASPGAAAQSLQACLDLSNQTQRQRVYNDTGAKCFISTSHVSIVIVACKARSRTVQQGRRWLAGMCEQQRNTHGIFSMHPYTDSLSVIPHTLLWPTSKIGGGTAPVQQLLSTDSPALSTSWHTQCRLTAPDRGQRWFTSYNYISLVSTTSGCRTNESSEVSSNRNHLTLDLLACVASHA